MLYWIGRMWVQAESQQDLFEIVLPDLDIPVVGETRALWAAVTAAFRACQDSQVSVKHRFQIF